MGGSQGGASAMDGDKGERQAILLNGLEALQPKARGRLSEAHDECGGMAQLGTHAVKKNTKAPSTTNCTLRDAGSPGGQHDSGQ
jgi:hypothetical protein